MSTIYLELLPLGSKFNNTSFLAAGVETENVVEQNLLSLTGTTITKQERPYVEFTYYHFEKSKPNKLSGVL
tara:strand:+ start:347 stop:559 length:213 start_codon:yes stop_codon:yes gene_type:complete